MNRSKKLIFLVITLLILSPKTIGQELNELWNGLRTPQETSQMPKGIAACQTAKQVKKQTISTTLIPTQRNEWIIADGWEMAEDKKVVESLLSIFNPNFDTSDWYNATLPGTVLTTLVNQGVYPDPFFGLNNLSIPDTLCRMSWWYRTSFAIPQNTGKEVNLLFNGINYRAEVFFNGKKLGNIYGAFSRGVFNVTSLIKKNEKNILAVRIHPPYNPGIPHEQSMVAGQGLNGGQLSLDGPTFISSVGWDWIPGIRDRNIGIWQDVRLRLEGNVTIGDAFVETDLVLPDTTQAMVKIKVPIINNSDKIISGNLTAKFEGANQSIPYTLGANEVKTLIVNQKVKSPKLWWPNGYGAQNLYHLELQSNDESGFSDMKKIRFGIRKMSYEFMINSPENGNHRICYSPLDANKDGKPIFDNTKRVVFDKEKNVNLPSLLAGVDESNFEQLSNDDPVGAYLVIKVNGVRIFCRGGNWGMDDGLKRSTRERIEPYMKLHKEANFNIVRNWTGESTEQTFYDLCDEYGMLVWNDFWITTDDTVDPNDQQLFLNNATETVRRFRNHPSIAIWCPRNEGFAPVGLELPLATMIAKEDPTRHYHGQSRYLNMLTSGPWGYFKDPSLYFTKNAQGFDTEMGTFAVPTANTIRKFIAPEDQWPINDVWAYHDLHHKSQNFGDFMAAVNRYGKPKSMEEFAKKAQMITYDSWRSMLEAWNSRMWNNTTGLILWMTHPAWPSMIWQTYSYDYETPGSYFGAKKACEPLHVQMNLPDNKVVIVNTTRQNRKGLNASIAYYDVKGKVLFEKSITCDAAANKLTDCFAPNVMDLPALYLVRLTLKTKDGQLISVNDYWKTDGKDVTYELFNSIGETKLKIYEAKGLIKVENASSVIAVAVKLNLRNKSNGEVILPAYFSDGYINLLPNEKRVIKLELPTGQELEKYYITAEGYNTK
jgi:hypothetical protein